MPGRSVGALGRDGNQPSVRWKMAGCVHGPRSGRAKSSPNVRAAGGFPSLRADAIVALVTLLTSLGMGRGTPGYPGGLPRGSAGEAGPVPPRPLPLQALD